MLFGSLAALLQNKQVIKLEQLTAKQSMHISQSCVHAPSNFSKSASYVAHESLVQRQLHSRNEWLGEKGKVVSSSRKYLS